MGRSRTAPGRQIAKAGVARDGRRLRRPDLEPARTRRAGRSWRSARRRSRFAAASAPGTRADRGATGRPCSGGGRFFVSDGGTMISIPITVRRATGGPNSCPILSGRAFIMVGMTDTLRVILEIGKKRRVVAGAMDWPGLDRWGPPRRTRSTSCRPTCRATPASPNGPAWRARSRRRATSRSSSACPARARPTSGASPTCRRRSSARCSPPPTSNGGSTSCRPAGPTSTTSRRASPASSGPGRAAPVAAATRSSATCTPTSPSRCRARSRSARRVEVVLTPDGPRDASAGLPRRDPRLQRRRQAGAHAGRSSSSSAAPPTTSWTTRGRWRTGTPIPEPAQPAVTSTVLPSGSSTMPM